MSDVQSPEQRIRKSLIKLVGGAVLMFGFAFAMVPLYEVLCDITGLNGRTADTAADGPDGVVQEERLVTVEFVATTRQGMPWEFRPDVTRIQIHPGECKQVSGYVKNPTGDVMYGQTVPSVTPGLAASHLKKTQCFCFDKQVLAAGAEEHMPMIFYLDPALPKHINTVTLSYTLFDITDRVEAEQKDLAAR